VWKGVPDFLEARHIVMAKRNDVDLVLYGSSPISCSGAGAPHRFLTGISDDDLARLYSSADVVAHSSSTRSNPADCFSRLFGKLSLRTFASSCK